ncbi:hypothetical protein H6G80_32470 [Nostoc sp. FACHB-87]|uniref:hypothetical protein n=1 Tax=Nostocaceae TaxID=1162 RepID=UPI001688A235|nr:MULTISPECIES: hypothetical protein [Nostocaceae]MBD2458762.1 hypothetical protein [Nostoc sp. FACHB-87]MBD2479818.1 hypothetical protein [Anabaena sp. FACHB-83]
MQVLYAIAQILTSRHLFIMTLSTIHDSDSLPEESEHKILLPPTDPSAEILEIPCYKLVYCRGERPKVYRAYKGDSMLGLVFKHLTHWSNAVDNIQHQEPLTAVIALDEFMQAAGVIRKVNAERVGAVA